MNHNCKVALKPPLIKMMLWHQAIIKTKISQFSDKVIHQQASASQSITFWQVDVRMNGLYSKDATLRWPFYSLAKFWD